MKKICGYDLNGWHDTALRNWKILPDEGPFKKAMKFGLISGNKKISNSYGYGETPIARSLQKKIMQFTTNQQDTKQMMKQINALKKTINHFKL